MEKAELHEAWTTARTAKYLSITGRAVRRLCLEGRLSAYKIQGKTAKEWRIHRDSAEQYAQAKSAEGRTNLAVRSDQAQADAMMSVMSELTKAMLGLTAELQAQNLLPPAPPKKHWWAFWQRGD